MLTTLEEVSKDLDKLIHTAMSQVATDSRADADLEIRLEAFRSELGVRDEPVFRLLLEDYKAEREFRNQNLNTLLKLVKDIQEMFNSES